jgi:CBS domain containing-hemolysin-like protein
MQIALIGKREGTLVDRESKVIVNLLKLRKIKVADVMTPRNVVTMLERTMPVSQVAVNENALRFSRLPVYDQGIDDIVGVVNRYDIFKALCAEKGDMAVGELCSEIHAVPELGSVSNALDEFVSRREHILLVVDEYGGVSGILTLEDAIETLLGIEIVDEYDEVEDMRMLALRLGQWRKNRMLGIVRSSLPNKNNRRTKDKSGF